MTTKPGRANIFILIFCFVDRYYISMVPVITSFDPLFRTAGREGGLLMVAKEVVVLAER